MKKGDRVKIDINAVELDKKKLQSSYLGTGLSPNHPFFTCGLHDEILKRVNSGQNPTIVSIVKMRYATRYANLIFDDGFECGLDVDKITKI